MPFAIPTLRDLVERARQSFRAHLPGTDAWLWPNNIGPTAKVIGGLTHEVFGYADWVSRQKFALTADGESLDLHGAELGLSRRPADFAAGLATITAAGAVSVQADAILARSDEVTYRVTQAGGTASPGVFNVPVLAEKTGKSGLAIEGTVLVAQTGVTGTASIAVGTGGLNGGADPEDDEAFRQRILFRKRNPPQGGSAADYVIWASSVPGVTRVFVERLFAGPGTVRVFPVFDDAYAGGVAPPARIAEVAQYLDALKPAGAQLMVSAPAGHVINVGISGLSPNTVPVQNAARAELQAAFRRLGRVSGTDASTTGLPYLATPHSFSRSWLWQAVANAAGEHAHVINAPAADVVIPAGSIPVLGTVTFS
jgi:uncharacterized phage protein gp47/JayE